ncbi:unnamed protein product [Lymnaea stagnalis]|uniref:Coiled-coil domain-containing protein 189 n=1 Tax=Lymnaea stagnalis TaxID=6523 RepID=A0AAV2I2B5_LYMST
MVPTGEKASEEEPKEPSIPLVIQPKKHKSKILVWSDLSVDAVDRLNESLNADHIKQVLADIFVLDNWKDNLKTGIIMDLYFYTLQFAREEGFTPEKISTFFSIIKEIFEVCIETPFGNVDHTFEYFKDLLHCHAVNHPPYSIELFSPGEVRRISEYTINTFFRHFKMYKYVFTAQVRLDLQITYIGMPTVVPSEDAINVNDEVAPPGDEDVHDPEHEKALNQDEELLQAKEDLKTIVKNFLTQESKKIEGKVEDQVQAAVEALNSKIDPLLGNVPLKKEQKGKKK